MATEARVNVASRGARVELDAVAGGDGLHPEPRTTVPAGDVKAPHAFPVVAAEVRRA